MYTPANTTQTFRPPRRNGLILHAATLLGLIAAGAWGLWQAAHAHVGLVFLAYLVPVLAAVMLAPLLLYRLYALRGAVYSLERDGMRLRWGLRVEDIPITAVQWVQPAEAISQRLPRPWLSWPGAWLGKRDLPLPHPLAELREIEFMASDAGHLVLVATPDRVYAISPVDPNNFIHTFQRLMELGSLTPIPQRSVYPAFLFGRVWADRPARIMLLGGILFSLLLLIWTSAVAPTRSTIVLRPGIAGAQPDPTPAVRLLLLPVLNLFIFLADLLLGLFFFRREDHDAQTLAYLLWSASLVTPLLFLVGVFFILRAS